MNRQSLWMTVLASAIVLTACDNDDNNDGPKVSVDDAPSGAYVVSLGSTDALTVGKYYAAADGSRLLLLYSGDGPASQLYRRRNASSAWVAVPAAADDVSVRLAQRSAMVPATVTLAGVAGNYRVALGDSAHADFSINAGGDIAAGSSACKLSGKVSIGSLPGTLKLTLATNACAGLPAGINGVLAVDPDYAPAAFRLVGDDAKQVMDLWAYAE